MKSLLNVSLFVFHVRAAAGEKTANRQEKRAEKEKKRRPRKEIENEDLLAFLSLGLLLLRWAWSLKIPLGHLILSRIYPWTRIFNTWQ